MFLREPVLVAKVTVVTGEVADRQRLTLERRKLKQKTSRPEAITHLDGNRATTVFVDDGAGPSVVEKAEHGFRVSHPS